MVSYPIIDKFDLKSIYLIFFLAGCRGIVRPKG